MATETRTYTYTHIGNRPHVGYVHCGRLYGHAAPRPGRVHALNAEPGGRRYVALCGERVHAEYLDDGGSPVKDHICLAGPAGWVTCKRCRKLVGG